MENSEIILWSGRPEKNAIEESWAASWFPFSILYVGYFLIHLFLIFLYYNTVYFLYLLSIYLPLFICFFLVFLYYFIKGYKNRQLMEVFYVISSKGIYIHSPRIKKISEEFISSPYNEKEEFYTSIFRLMDNNIIYISMKNIYKFEINVISRYNRFFGVKGCNISFYYLDSIQFLQSSNDMIRFSQINESEIKKICDILLQKFAFSRDNNANNNREIFIIK